MKIKTQKESGKPHLQLAKYTSQQKFIHWPPPGGRARCIESMRATKKLQTLENKGLQRIVWRPRRDSNARRFA